MWPWCPEDNFNLDTELCQYIKEIEILRVQQGVYNSLDLTISISYKKSNRTQ